jgi:hypothetical protein
MCFLTKCSKCNKISWDGCGRHVKNLASQVAESDMCKCKLWE